jgi:DNA-directed RNA polymerase subunit RPC12/RpoP
MQFTNNDSQIGQGAGMGGQQDYEERPAVLYVCGKCGKDHKLDHDTNVIKCPFCAGRIFYKKRERKLIQYESR